MAYLGPGRKGVYWVKTYRTERPPFGARILSVGQETGCDHGVVVRFLFVVALEELEGREVGQ